MHLIDNETKVDLLNVEPIAATVVKLLRSTPKNAVTIGLHGDWGAGKSSLLAMIETAFAGDGDVLCLRFNGWQFQGFEDAKIVLLETIVGELMRVRGTSAKAKDLAKNIGSRINWLKLAKKGGSLAFTAFTGIPTPDLIADITSGLGRLLENPGDMISKQAVKDAVEGVKDVIEAGSAKQVPEEIHAFRKEFDELLDATNVKQLIVLIDDLDRCLPKPAIETLEAIRLFLFTSRTAFVIAADEAMIEYAVREHFPDLPASTGPLSYTRNYLEKLIQVPFRIPALGAAETRIYTTLLLIQAEVGEDDPAFAKLLDTARGLLKRPWQNPGLTRSAVEAAMGRPPPGVQDAISLSHQIGPILADGTKGNPRQIKRFINSLLLRYAIAEARGFASDIQRDALAKIILAERFMPRFFDRLSALVAGSEGKVAALGALEQLARAPAAAAQSTPRPGAPKSGTAGKVDAPARAMPTLDEVGAALLEVWREDEALLAWTRIDPLLGDLDLRPYVFVTRDRRAYFSGSAAASRLDELVDRLMAPSMAVAALDADLRALPSGDLEQLFDAVRDRVLEADDLMTQPPGVAGLTLLARIHPPLQRRLVETLEDLPVKDLGPWVVRGWTGVFTDTTAKAVFDRLMGVWAAQDESALLKAAAGTVRNLPAARPPRRG